MNKNLKKARKFLDKVKKSNEVSEYQEPYLFFSKTRNAEDTDDVLFGGIDGEMDDVKELLVVASKHDEIFKKALLKSAEEIKKQDLEKAVSGMQKAMRKLAENVANIGGHYVPISNPREMYNSGKEVFYFANMQSQRVNSWTWLLKGINLNVQFYIKKEPFQSGGIITPKH